MKPQRAKLFQNGGSQAVRLPKSCRFPDTDHEVLIQKEGDRIVLTPMRPGWSDRFLRSLGSWDEDIERPKQEPLSKMAKKYRR